MSSSDLAILVYMAALQSNSISSETAHCFLFKHCEKASQFCFFSVNEYGDTVTSVRDTNNNSYKQHSSIKAVHENQ